MAVMTANTIARPYAKALFAAVKGTDQLADWGQRLARLAVASQLPEVASLLNHPKLTAENAADLFMQAIPGDQRNDQCARLLNLLATNRRLAVLPQITEQFQAFCDQATQNVRVTVRSAFELDEATTATLTEQLKAYTQQCAVALQCETDPDLIGGVVLQIGDTVIDNSVRGKLRRLHQNLLA